MDNDLLGEELLDQLLNYVRRIMEALFYVKPTLKAREVVNTTCI